MLIHPFKFQLRGISVKTNMRLALSAFSVICFLITVYAASFGSPAQSRAPYGSDKPLPAAKLFAEGSINSTGDDYGPTFTPDGKTIFFVKRTNRQGAETIVSSSFEGGKWSAPQAAPFSGKGLDKEPFISPDGKRLFFASTRLPDGSYGKSKSFDIWMAERTGSGWSAPVNLGPMVNSPTYDNYPAVAANGNLYFASEREGGMGENDLYVSRYAGGRYEKAENLGETINTDDTDADPYIAPDESYIIFSSDRTGTLGEGDLYISFNQQGKWTAPRNLGPKVNTTDYEYTPLVSPDKKYLFFSRGWGDIYQIDLSALNMKP